MIQGTSIFRRECSGQGREFQIFGEIRFVPMGIISIMNLNYKTKKPWLQIREAFLRWCDKVKWCPLLGSSLPIAGTVGVRAGQPFVVDVAEDT